MIVHDGTLQSWPQGSMDVCSIVPVQTAPIEPTLLEAEVATAALLDDRHAGQLYELTGPRLLTFNDAIRGDGPHLEAADPVHDHPVRGVHRRTCFCRTLPGHPAPPLGAPRHVLECPGVAVGIRERGVEDAAEVLDRTYLRPAVDERGAGFLDVADHP